MIFAAVANQASCFALGFLGRDPQRPGVPPAHRASLRLRAYQNKRHDQRSCLLFWVPAAIGGLHPPVIQMLGAAKPPLRNSPPPLAASNLRRTCGVAQKGRWAVLLKCCCKSEISVLTVPTRLKKSICESRWIFSAWASRPLAAPPFRDFDPRAGKARPPEILRFAPNLRRTCGAGQKAGFVLLRHCIFRFVFRRPSPRGPEGRMGLLSQIVNLKNF